MLLLCRSCPQLPCTKAQGCATAAGTLTQGRVCGLVCCHFYFLCWGVGAVQGPKQEGLSWKPEDLPLVKPYGWVETRDSKIVHLGEVGSSPVHPCMPSSLSMAQVAGALAEGCSLRGSTLFPQAGPALPLLDLTLRRSPASPLFSSFTFLKAPHSAALPTTSCGESSTNHQPVFHLLHLGRPPACLGSGGTRLQLLCPWAALPGTQTEQNEEDSDLPRGLRLAYSVRSSLLLLTSQLSQPEGPPTLAGWLQYILFLLFMSDASRQAPLKSGQKNLSLVTVQL